MTRPDTLYPFRPVNAVHRLGASPACLLSGVPMQRALAQAASRLVVFELASVPVQARGVLRAAQNLDVAMGLAFRPRLDVRAAHFNAFVRDVLALADELGFHHPLFLSAGPFYLTSPDAAALQALERHVFEAVDAGFTEVSIALGGAPSAATAEALAPALQPLRARDLSLEVVLPPTQSALEWQRLFAGAGIEAELFASSELAGDKSRPEPPASWGLRPRDAQLPEAFDLRLGRLTLDPFTDIVLQVISDEAHAEIDKLCAQGFRSTDVLGVKPRFLGELDGEARQWVESNIYFDAMELFEALALQGSADLVRRFLDEQRDGAGDL